MWVDASMHWSVHWSVALINVLTDQCQCQFWSGNWLMPWPVHWLMHCSDALQCTDQCTQCTGQYIACIGQCAEWTGQCTACIWSLHHANQDRCGVPVIALNALISSLTRIACTGNLLLNAQHPLTRTACKSNFTRHHFFLQAYQTLASGHPVSREIYFFAILKLQ